MAMHDTESICCSFCGKHQDEVKKLIAGRPEVFICDDCIVLCNNIIREELGDEEPADEGESQCQLCAILWDEVRFHQPDDWTMDAGRRHSTSSIQGLTYTAHRRTHVLVKGANNGYQFDGKVLKDSRLIFSGNTLHLDLRVPIGSQEGDS